MEELKRKKKKKKLKLLIKKPSVKLLINFQIDFVAKM